MIITLLALAAAGAQDAPVNPEIARLDKAWEQCVDTQVRRYARLDEPAATVLTAAFNACGEQKEALRQYVMGRAKSDLAKDAIGAWMEGSEQGMKRCYTRVLLDERLRLQGN